MATKNQPSKSRAALDAEARAKDDYKSPFLRAATVGPDDQTALDQNGFVGVDPIYQNAANETDQPTDYEGDTTAEDLDKLTEEQQAAADQAAADKAAADKAAADKSKK